MQHPRDLNVCIMIKCGLVAQKEIHYVYKKTSKIWHIFDWSRVQGKSTFWASFFVKALKLWYTFVQA